MPLTAPNNMRNRYAIILILSIGAIAATSNVAARAYCGSFLFGKPGNSDRAREVERALARVYAPDALTTAHHLGAATVIHIHPMLLVTASHVVADDVAKINFPSLGENLYSAKVIARSRQRLPVPAMTDQSNATAENADFAVLLVEQAPDVGVQALEIWFEEVDKENPHDLVGYARDTSAPLWGRDIQLAPNAECAWRVREVTFTGDSGGAAVSKEGLLVGIVLRGHEGGSFDGGAMGQATVLPLSCVRDTILSALDLAEPRSNSNVLDVDRSVLMQELQPPPTVGWIDNLEFARGIRDLMVNRTLVQKMQVRNAIACPIFRSAFDRKLGYETALSLIKYAAQNQKDAADELKSIGDEQKNENATLAKRLYASAVDSYNEYVDARHDLWAGVSPRPEMVQAAIGRADALGSLAEITNDSATKVAALAAAAHAIQAAPSKDPSRGLAFAVLGKSAFNVGDFQTAIEAFSSASQSGFSANWVKRDYAESFRRRDNIIEADGAKDYTTLGAYRPLTSAKVRTLAMGHEFSW